MNIISPIASNVQINVDEIMVSQIYNTQPRFNKIIENDYLTKFLMLQYTCIYVPEKRGTGGVVVVKNFKYHIKYYGIV